MSEAAPAAKGGACLVSKGLWSASTEVVVGGLVLDRSWELAQTGVWRQLRPGMQGGSSGCQT